MSFEQYSGWITIIGSVIGSIIAVGTLISRRLTEQEKDLRGDLLKLSCTSHTLDKRLTIIETYSNLFWDNYKKEAAKVLTHPLHPEIDEYLRIQDKRELTRDEKEALVDLLQNIVDRNYDVLYGDKDLGIYSTLLVRFRTELQAEPLVNEIEKKFNEESQKVEREHQEKLEKAKKKKWRFW